MNWRTLGETEKEKSAMGWFYFSLAMLGVYVLMGVFMEKPEEADGAARGLGFLYLLVWYFSAGRAQARYVKEKLGSNYPRRAWGKPLLIGVAAIIGFFTLAVIVVLIAAAIGGGIDKRNIDVWNILNRDAVIVGEQVRDTEIGI